MNKKGQGLSLNVIIIAVLAILVLVIVAAFFLGGFSNLGGKIKSVFSGTTIGSDLDLTISTCNNLCERAKGLDASSVGKSAYCQTSFDVDSNVDGKLEESEKNQKCSAFITCPVTCS